MKANKIEVKKHNRIRRNKMDKNIIHEKQTVKEENKTEGKNSKEK